MTNKQCHYGFVYLWFDRKLKKYYVGSHWGPENDGYVCSSNWMRDAHRRRPQDFKRRVLKRVYTNRQDLIAEEHRYLSMIKKTELRERYYNLNNSAWEVWHNRPDTTLTVGQKISARLKGKKRGPYSEEYRKAIAEGRRGISRTAEANKKQSESRKALGLKHSEEWKSETSRRNKEQIANGTRVMPRPDAEAYARAAQTRMGHETSQETREKIAKKNSKQYLITYMDGSTEVITGLKAYGRERGIPYVTLFKAAQHGTPSPKYRIQSIT